MTDPSHRVIELAKRFTINWLNLADTKVPPTIMTADYRVHIGSTELNGLAAYTTGTIGQLHQFPGLTLTVHEIISDGSQLAMVFTEHGASARHDFRPAAWRGVALFRCERGLLAENWTQEDYYARRRQLSSGAADLIPAPTTAPWTTEPHGADPASESAARAWLNAPDFSDVSVDDGSGITVQVAAVSISRLFSAGDSVAVAGNWRGKYCGPLDGVDATGQPVSIGFCCVLRIVDGRVVAGYVVTDRHGLRRALMA